MKHQIYRTTVLLPPVELPQQQLLQLASEVPLASS